MFVFGRGDAGEGIAVFVCLLIMEGIAADECLFASVEKGEELSYGGVPGAIGTGNFGLGEVEILSVSDPDALAKAGSLSCLLNQNPLSPGNPKAIFLR
ncbi:hypothetical protein WN943_005534 [Citrus x changshan-huyou]